MTVGAAAQQRAIRYEDAAGAEPRMPFVPGWIIIQMDIHPIVGNGIGQHAAGTAGAGRYPEAAIENVEVNLLRPRPVSMLIAESGQVTSFAPGFIVQHAAAVMVIMRDADRID